MAPDYADAIQQVANTYLTHECHSPDCQRKATVQDGDGYWCAACWFEREADGKRR